MKQIEATITSSYLQQDVKELFSESEKHLMQLTTDDKSIYLQTDNVGVAETLIIAAAKLQSGLEMCRDNKTFISINGDFIPENEYPEPVIVSCNCLCRTPCPCCGRLERPHTPYWIEVSGELCCDDCAEKLSPEIYNEVTEMNERWWKAESGTSRESAETPDGIPL